MPNHWAVIVGINRYRHWKRLKNAVADAQAVRNILVRDYGFHRNRVRLLLDQHATKASLLRLINHTIPHRWDVKADDQLLFFFAGHSGRAKRKKQKPWYLATVDSQRSTGSPAWETVLTRDEVRRLESTFAGRHIFYIFDSCYSGLVFSAQGPGPGQHGNRSVQALVAGRGGDPVADAGGTGHSIFTESLLEALGGWGGMHADEDGRFQGSDLINFIRIDVPRQIRQRAFTSRQKPFGGPLIGNPQGTEFSFLPRVPRLPGDIVEPLTSPHVQIRRTAIAQLGQIVDERLGTVKLLALTRMTRDSSASVRQDVVAELMKMGGKDAFKQIMQLAQDPDEAVTLAAVRALGEIGRGDQNAIKVLKLLRGNGSRRLQRAVNSSLALLGVRSAVSRVVADLPTEQGSIRREIIELLKEVAVQAISRDVLAEMLVTLLGKNSWETRRAAAEAIGELGLPSGEPRLRRLVSTPSEHFMVRYSAAEALGHLGRPASRDALLNVLTYDRSLLVRSAAAEALGIVGGNTSVAALGKALAVDPEWRVRRAAAESCGLLRFAEALPSLRASILDPHFRVRLSVVWALGEIPDRETVQILEEISENDLSLHVRRAAEHALERVSAELV